ncbi:MAG: hypothetical protein NTU60_09760 [Candidatus Aminicenantes bacterium]|nr:hypothetical protein [Candidatus Aminicenantes bacterium]
MKGHGRSKIWFHLAALATALSVAGLCVSGQENAPKPTVFQLGDCRIAVLEVSFWRDWMPIVAHPGPDHGSPLRAVIKLRLSNSSAADVKLAWTAAVIGNDGKSNPLEFRALPDGGAIWNRTLTKGGSREIVMTAQDGPYLPVGSLVCVEMIWTDQKNKTVLVKTPKAPIGRTD